MTSTTNKICTICKQAKSLDQYQASNTSRCRPCNTEYSRQYKQRNIERVREIMRKAQDRQRRALGKPIRFNPLKHSVKVCTDCNQEKALTEFPKNKGTIAKRGYIIRAQCRDCTRERKNNYNRRPEIRQKNLERIRNDRKRPDRKPAYLRRELKKNYGITLQQYKAICDLQCNCCAICKKPAEQTTHKRLDVDHNHITGKIRGLLCSQCNTGLGLFKDNPILLAEAIAYLERYRPALEDILLLNTIN